MNVEKNYYKKGLYFYIKKVTFLYKKSYEKNMYNFLCYSYSLFSAYAKKDNKYHGLSKQSSVHG